VAAVPNGLGPTPLIILMIVLQTPNAIYVVFSIMFFVYFLFYLAHAC
jgi:hypothetical protein